MDRPLTAGAPDRATIRALMRRSDLRGFAQLARHVAFLALTGVGVGLAAGGPWLVPAMVAHGVALAFLFAPLHETVHRTAFASRWPNAALAWACGLALLIPPTDFRSFHWAHHRHTQDPMRDPELAAPKPGTLPGYLLHLSGMPYWRDRIAALVRQAAGAADAPYLPAAARSRAVAEARLFLGLYGTVISATVVSGSPAPLLFWALPLVLGQPALRAFLLAEHTACPTVADMTRNTRTTLTGWPVRLLGWNMSYHAEHHLHPAVPFHALPRLHRLVARQLQRVSPGYPAAHREILAALASAPAVEYSHRRPAGDRHTNGE